MKIKVEFSKETTKEKIREWKNRVRSFFRNLAAKILRTTATVVENANVILPVAAIAVPASVKFYRIATRNKINRREIRRRERQVYDPVLGYRVNLKRKLRAEEVNELSRRRHDGETVADILYSMGLVKNYVF